MKTNHFFYFLASAALVISLSIVLFLLASGYRFDPKTKTIQGTGIIAVSSIPDGALIYINDVPKDASNTSIIDLSPGEYAVRLTKDGFHDWKNTVKVKKELVTKIEALLIPQYPKLQPLTFTGVRKSLLSPDGQKIIYTVVGGSSAGIWLMDLEERPFNLSRKAQILFADTPTISYSTSSYTWSPDSESILIEFPEVLTNNNAKFGIYNLASSSFEFLNSNTETLNEWEQLTITREDNRLSLVNLAQKELIQGLKIVQWSPDNQYILYKSENEQEITYRVLTIKPTDFPTIQEPSPTTTDEVTDSLLYSVTASTPHTVQWYPDSRHLIITEQTGAATNVSIIEKTGENRTSLFSGDIENLQVYPNSTGSKIIVLTKFNEVISNYNLYSIDLR